MLSQQIIYKFIYFVNNIYIKYSNIYITIIIFIIYLYYFVFIHLYYMYSYIRHTLLCESLPLYPGRIGLVRPTMFYFFLITFLILFFFFIILPSHYLSPAFTLEGCVLFLLEPHGSPPSHVVAAHSQNQINPPKYTNVLARRTVPSCRIS